MDGTQSAAAAFCHIQTTMACGHIAIVLTSLPSIGMSPAVLPIRQEGRYSGRENVEVVLDTSFHSSKLVDVHETPFHVKAISIAEAKFGSAASVHVSSLL